MRYGHQSRGLSTCSERSPAAVNSTTWRSCGASVTLLATRRPSIETATSATTRTPVVLVTSALAARSALASVLVSTVDRTYEWRTVTGPLVVTYTGPHKPMFLSGGVGFQSTQVMARSPTPGGKTSTATALTPVFATFDTSNT